jgi:hypothetical protein
LIQQAFDYLPNALTTGLYQPFKNNPEVCNFPFEIADLIFSYEKCINPYKNAH